MCFELVFIVTTRHTNHCIHVIDIFITVIYIFHISREIRPGVPLFSRKHNISHVRCHTDSKGRVESLLLLAASLLLRVSAAQCNVYNETVLLG